MTEIVARRWNVDAALTAYLTQVQQRSGSVRTPIEYRNIIKRFLLLGGDPLEAGPDAVHAFAYAPGPSGKEPSPSTVAVRLAALRGFYDFLRRMGRVERNPVDDVERPKPEAPAVHGLAVDEVKALMAAIPDTDAGQRDRAIILTAILTGLRRSELLNLRRGDLTRNGTVFYTTRVKGGRTIRRELPWPAFDAISAALERAGRPLESLEPEARLFDVSAHGFYLNLQRYSRNAKLRGVSVHSLRHTAAKLRRDAGAKLEEVQRLLNHSNLATTSRYLARLEGEDDPGWKGVASLLGV